MRDELYERFLHELSQLGVRRHHVNRAVEWKHRCELRHLHDLPDHSLPPETGQTLIPDLRQQLLHVRMSHELLLLVLDGELESLQRLTFARLPILAGRIKVQHDLQLVAGARVIQQ